MSSSTTRRNTTEAASYHRGVVGPPQKSLMRGQIEGKLGNFTILLVTFLLCVSLPLSGCSTLGGFTDSIFGTSTPDASTANARKGIRQGSAAGMPRASAPLNQENDNLNIPSLSPSLRGDYEINAASLDQPAATTLSGLEVTWKVPQEQTPSFVIYYGTDSKALSSRIEVATARLETLTDPEQGPLYRYIVPDVPAIGALFVAVAAFDGVSEGPRSDPLPVSAP